MAEKYFQQRYIAHKYWGRRPWYAVRALIEEHTQPGEVVLDSFCGSGTTLAEALATGRRAIGVDLNPMAAFISRVTVTPADLTALSVAFEALRGQVEAEIHALYERDPEEIEPRHWYPTDLLPVSVFGIRKCDAGMTVADLFSRRNLAATALLCDAIKNLVCSAGTRDLLRFAFTASLAQFTKMIRTKKTGTGWWVNAYRIPRTYRENDVWSSYENKVRSVFRMKEETNTLLRDVRVSSEDGVGEGTDCVVRIGSATDLSFLPDDSVDYVFIDPPWAIKYFDLSVLWCSWLGFSLPFEQEIFPWEKGFRGDMARALSELARVLRPGRIVTVNFATRYMELLNEWREAVEASGLDWVGLDALQQDQLSFVQRQRAGALKGNYLLNLRKHDGGERAVLPAGQSARPTNGEIVTAVELEGMITAVLEERGPLTYDAIFQALYPELMRRPLACDLDTLLTSRFDCSIEEDRPYEEGVWSISDSNVGPPRPELFRPITPTRSRAERAWEQPALPLGE